MTETDATPLKLRWYPALAAVFLVFVVVAVYSASVARHTSDYDQDRAAQRYQTLAKLRADDQKALTTADWVDQAKGVVRIPIDEAMPQAVAMLMAKPLQMGAPIPGAAPAAVPPPAPASAGSTPPAPSTSAAPAPGAPNK